MIVLVVIAGFLFLISIYCFFLSYAVEVAVKENQEKHKAKHKAAREAIEKINRMRGELLRDLKEFSENKINERNSENYIKTLKLNMANKIVQEALIKMKKEAGHND